MIATAGQKIRSGQVVYFEIDGKVYPARDDIDKTHELRFTAKRNYDKGEAIEWPLSRPKRQRVNLRTVKDDLTGLTMNIYEWRDKDEIKIECEVGNRIVGNSLPFQALPYDPAIDGARAEAHRAMIESSLL
jgi:hypothetical protein